MNQLDHSTESASGIVAGVLDDAVGRCTDRCAGGGPKIDSPVQTGSFGDRMVAHSKAAGDVNLGKRLSAGYRGQKKLLFEGGMAGDRNSLRDRQRCRRGNAQDRFDLVEIIGQGHQFPGAGLDLRVELLLMRQ